MIAMMIETNLRRQSKTGMKHVGLLKKNCNARLNSNKQDKEAKQGAMEEMLKNWEKIPCQRCDNLQKKLNDFEREAH